MKPAYRAVFRRRRSTIPWFRAAGWGTVYLLQSRTEPALFKVGYTKRKTKTRKGELGRLVEGGLAVRYTITLPHAYATEQKVLGRLRRRWFGRRDRRGTEWFHLRKRETINDIARLIERTGQETRLEARLKLAWPRGVEIRTFSGLTSTS